jgi:FlaG/FlaF family flagellin (archaellin)
VSFDLHPLVVLTRARIAELRRREDGVSEIVAVLLIIAAVIAIAATVFEILANKASSSANSKNF